MFSVLINLNPHCFSFSFSVLLGVWGGFQPWGVSAMVGALIMGGLVLFWNFIRALLRKWEFEGWIPVRSVEVGVGPNKGLIQICFGASFVRLCHSNVALVFGNL
ncbi:unnamed protein product [Camellia sinensis]